MNRNAVLTIGPIYCDLLLEGFSKIPLPGQEEFFDSYTLSVGGNAIVAIALAKVGLDSSLLSTVGDDPLGEQLLALLKQQQVETSSILPIAGEKTNLSLIMNGRTDRSFLTWVQKLPSIEKTLERRLEELSKHSYEHVHICFEYLAIPCMQRFVKAQREKGVSLSTALGFQDSLEWCEQSRRKARMVDWVFMNLSEAKKITEKGELYQIMQELRTFVEIPVITLGPDGCCALSKEGDLLHTPAYEVEVVNTTGSGDSFCAGFIYGVVHNAGLQRCLQYGSYLGSLTAAAKESVSPLIDAKSMEAAYE